MQTVKGLVEFDGASADSVYALLTDYESCPDVFANIASSRVLVGDDGKRQVLQACKWQFLGLAGTFDVHLTVSEDAAARLLVFRLVASSYMRDFEGRWQVVPTGSSSCRVEHVLAVKPTMPIPAAIASFTSSIFTRQVANILGDLAVEVERRKADGGRVV